MTPVSVGPARRLLAAIAALAYLPLLWSSPGKVAADTKTYLYLDPAKLLARAPYLWDEHIGMGTVTHQNIGYLFPMGPYYWLMSRLQVPDWIAQRLWLGTLLFAAGAGIVYLCGTIGWHGHGVGVAAVSYMLSPYIFDYASRLSAILLPWAALGWLLAFTIRSVQQGGWRWPARFAFVVAVVGGVNATSLLLVGLAPVWWLLHAVLTKDVPLKQAAAAVVRLGCLTIPVSLWWMAGLLLQGRYGIPILRYTETYDAVARTTTVPEVLRGLGYWFFYGQDKVAPWVTAGRPYTQGIWLVLTSFGLVGLGLLSAAAVRWRQRGFALGLLLIGVVVSTGAHPYANPSAFGGLFKRFIESSPGMALRSTPRAVPLITLALALFLGAGSRAMVAHFADSPRPLARLGRLAPRAAVVLVMANMPTFLLGHIYTPSLLRAESIPEYWAQAARSLDAKGSDTRVLETPGSDFADYRWGGTVDPITPGLMDRPYVARELVPYGSPASADLLNAFERRQQDGLFEPAAVAPLARLMSVGDVVVRSDLQFERYRLITPRRMWAQYSQAELSPPVAFGTRAPNVPISRLPLLDEAELATPAIVDPPAVATLAVPAVPPIVHLAPADAVVIDGDGEGLYDAAAAGLIENTRPVLYAADLAADAGRLRQAVAASSRLVVTDENRRQARRWGSVRENLGVTEQAGEVALRRDINDNRLDLFPGASDDTATVVQQRGVLRVQASGYGNPITYTPEDRAANAFDGDPLTAWRVGAFSDVTGEKLEVQLTSPTTTDQVRLQQPTWGALNRWLTQVELRFDGRDPLIIDLDDSSRVAPGQTITFPTRSFSTLTITLVATNFTKLPGYRGLVAVGFAEVAIAGVRVDEVIRPPVELLARSDGHPLDLVLTRQRANQIEPNRSDPELTLSRTFALPSARDFVLTGDVRASGVASDAALRHALGASGAVAVASARLNGTPRAQAGSAIDGDPSTAWTTPIDKLQQSIDVTNPSPLSLDHIDFTVVNDGRHSLPTAISLSVDGSPAMTMTVPTFPAGSGVTATATVRLALANGVTGSRFRLDLVEANVVTTIDYISELPVALPIAVAEIGLPGLQLAALPALMSSGCRSDLVTMDGTPLDVRLDGTTTAALDRAPVKLMACAPLRLAAGPHLLRTVNGRDEGLDVDRLVLHSDGPTRAAAVVPTLKIRGQGPVSYDLTTTPTSSPFWLVLGQSRNDGWQVSVRGGTAGPATIVDGYANGWLISPDRSGPPLQIALDWAPQRIVWVALAASALALIAVLAIGWWPRTRTRNTPLPRRLSPFVAQIDLAATSNMTSIGGRDVLIVAASTVIFAALGGLIVGIATGCVAALVVLVPGLKRVIVWIPAGLIGFVAVFAIAKTRRYHLPTDLEWPRAFGPAHQVGWLAIGITLVVGIGACRRLGAHGRPHSLRRSSEPVNHDF